MFALLSVPLIAYVLYAAALGEVWVKDGIGARLVSRERSPVYFWICIGIYSALAAAMALVF